MSRNVAGRGGGGHGRARVGNTLRPVPSRPVSRLSTYTSGLQPLRRNYPFSTLGSDHYPTVKNALLYYAYLQAEGRHGKFWRRCAPSFLSYLRKTLEAESISLPVRVKKIGSSSQLLKIVFGYSSALSKSSIALQFWDNPFWSKLRCSRLVLAP